MTNRQTVKTPTTIQQITALCEGQFFELKNYAIHYCANQRVLRQGLLKFLDKCNEIAKILLEVGCVYFLIAKHRNHLLPCVIQLYSSAGRCGRGKEKRD